MNKFDLIFIGSVLLLSSLLELISFQIGLPTTVFFFSAGIFFALFIIFDFKVLPIVLVQRMFLFHFIYRVNLQFHLLVILGLISVSLYIILSKIWKPVLFYSRDTNILARSTFTFFNLVFFSYIWLLLANLSYQPGDLVLSVMFGINSRLYGMITVFPLLLSLYNKYTNEEFPVFDRYFDSTGKSKIKPYYLPLLFIYSMMMTIVGIYFTDNNPHFNFTILIPVLLLSLQSDLKDIIHINFLNSLAMYLIYVIFQPIMVLSDRIELISYLVLFLTINIIISTNFTITQLHRSSRERTEIQLHHMQKTEVIGRMAGGIAHEVNNFMQILSGYLDLLSTTHLSEMQEQYTENMKNALNRTSNLMSQMLMISRKTIPIKKEQSLNHIISQNRSLYEMMLGDSFNLHVELGSEIPAIPLNADQINQIILNLLGNSKDVMPVGGEINLFTDKRTLTDTYYGTIFKIPKGKYVTLTILDQGPGISFENLSQIFEPFYTSKPSGKGTGLGLSIVESIVLSHNGYIDITSELGMGCKISIYLPFGDFIHHPENHKPVLENINHYEIDISKVIIVDDEKELVDVVAEILNINNIEVERFSNPREVIQYLSQRSNMNIDLIISDLLMKQMNGFQMIQSINQIGIEIPILFITGYPDDVIESINENGNEFKYQVLRKPFSSEQLLDSIKQLNN